MAALTNLPTIQRLKSEDYLRQKTWQESMRDLVQSLNYFIQPVYNILNGNISYSNIVVPQVITRTITATTTTTFSFTNPLTINPSGVYLVNVYVSGNTATHPIVTTQVMWHLASGNLIQVDNVIGLTSGTTYVLTLAVL